METPRDEVDFFVLGPQIINELPGKKRVLSVIDSSKNNNEALSPNKQ